MLAYPLLPLEKLIEYASELKSRYGITNKEIADYTGLEPSTVTKIFRYKEYGREISYSEAYDMISYIAQRISLIPVGAATSEYCSRVGLKTASYSDSLSSVALLMLENDVSQLIILDSEGDYLGLVTELSLLRRIMRVHKKSEGIRRSEPESLEDLKKMSVGDADVIEYVSPVPLDTSFVEVAELLTHFYAIPLSEKAKVTSIITRADILKLICGV